MCTVFKNECAIMVNIHAHGTEPIIMRKAPVNDYFLSVPSGKWIMREHALFHISACTSPQRHCVSFHVSVPASIQEHVHTLSVCLCVCVCVCVCVCAHVRVCVHVFMRVWAPSPPGCTPCQRDHNKLSSVQPGAKVPCWCWDHRKTETLTDALP